MNQNIEFKIYSGTKEIEITTEEIGFRGSTFKQIYIDGEKTSLTTTMGHTDWEGAFPAIREIFSNALDEDTNATLVLSPIAFGMDGYTSIFINCTPEVQEVYDNRSDYFNIGDEKVLHKNKYAKLLPKTENSRIFRRGILAVDPERGVKALYNYDIHSIDVNESRLIKYSFMLHEQIGKFWENCTNANLLNLYISGLERANAGLLEHDCILEEYKSKAASVEFLDMINSNTYVAVEHAELAEDHEIKGRRILPLKLIKRFQTYVPTIDVWGITSIDDSLVYKKAKLSDSLSMSISDAVGILVNTSYKERLKSEIIVANFLNKKTLGFADIKQNLIVLSTNLSTYSAPEIAKVIVEEQEHLTAEFDDMTRQFQNHLVNLYYSELTKS